MPKNKLSHSRTATDNLTNIINEEGTDIVFIQEPYNINNMVVGMPRSCTIHIGCRKETGSNSNKT